jgi:thioesterase domain-containing protein
MILEIDNGRELELPDGMPDETARQLKRLILACEERARAAEARVAAIQAEMAALRRDFTALAARPTEHGPIVEAIGRMHEAHKIGVREIVAAVSADRVMVPDQFGEYNRSKAVK